MSARSDFSLGPSRLTRLVYRVMLRCYPAAFRRRYEEEMVGVFQEEWAAAREKGAVELIGYVTHLCWDVMHTVPREWSAATSRVAVLGVVAAGLGLAYFSLSSTPLLLKVVGCAAFSGMVGVAAVGLRSRGWRAQIRLMALGLAAGWLLASLIDLRPRVVAPPRGPLLPVTEQGLDGPEIFRRVAAVYRGAESYTDTGEVQTTFAVPFHRTTLKTFSTAFTRNGGFRFDFKDQFERLDSWNEYAMWLEGGKARAWWTLEPQMNAPKDLAYALSGPAGISSNASTYVPGLLFPESRIGALSYDARRSELLGIENVDGREAFKVAFDRAPGLSSFAWIDTRSYLIVRIVVRDVLKWWPGTTVEEVLVYHPRLNAPVEASSLVYHPHPVRSLVWRTLASGRTYPLFFGVGLSLLMTLLNLVHRRLLSGAWRWRKEAWLVALGRRLSAGSLGVFAASVGLWLGGNELDLTFTNYLLALFLMQAGFGCYVLQRRARGYARLAAT